MSDGVPLKLSEKYDLLTPRWFPPSRIWYTTNAITSAKLPLRLSMN